jgi:type II secretory pathway pseudopilin PulG
LIEVVVAMAIIAMALSVLITALSTGAFGVRTSNRLGRANNLAASQLETIKGSAYDAAGAYPIVAYPPDYDVSLSHHIVSPGLQHITVSVAYQGETLAVVSNYKVDR